MTEEQLKKKNSLHAAIADGSGIISLVSSFLMHFIESIQVFVTDYGQYILSPIGRIADFANMYFSWKAARLNKYSADSILAAWVDTLGALASSSIMVLFFLSKFGTITLSEVTIPFMFVFLMSFKAIYHLLMFLKTSTLLSIENETTKKSSFKWSLFSRFIILAIYGLFGVGIGLVSIEGYESLYYLTLIGGGLVVLFAINQACLAIKSTFFAKVSVTDKVPTLITPEVSQETTVSVGIGYSQLSKDLLIDLNEAISNRNERDVIQDEEIEEEEEKEEDKPIITAPDEKRTSAPIAVVIACK